MTTASVRTAVATAWIDPDGCRLDDFVAIVEQPTDPADYPHADHVDRGVLVYAGDRLRAATTDDDGRREVQAELVRALTDGPRTGGLLRRVRRHGCRRPGHRGVRRR